jgi:hypothetical protein
LDRKAASQQRYNIAETTNPASPSDVRPLIRAAIQAIEPA